MNRNSLTFRNTPSIFRDSFFNDFDNEFFNHSLIPFSYPYYNPHYHHYPFSHSPRSLERQFNRIFPNNKNLFKPIDFQLKTNLSEDENNYYIQADLTGMEKDQIKIELSDDDRILTISGEKRTMRDNISDTDNNYDNNNNNKKKNKNDKEEEKKERNYNKNYSMMNYSYENFERSFGLPDNADTDNVQAKMDNGILKITLNKINSSKQNQNRTIQIQ
ncbi:HSP20-like chaperone [Anaeromyces robustus]|uniref:HSP20-like chaperone n=1 Tax=Anaeromyces robustus TaxID=1754192 RepID=A0A1Y1XMY5_9FUNG|nr:HSP20-like chaperone [Anaeromyces robustus]|eukprot:ORX87101.1 HSP20-like chaperone [Anaeromyces robustus]